MSLFDDMDVVDSGDTVAFNTGTTYDLATGIFKPGIDGEWYLNGGLTQHINAYIAPNSNFKSTIANSFLMRALGIYKGSEAIINDTENALDKDKIDVEQNTKPIDVEAEITKHTIAKSTITALFERK